MKFSRDDLFEVGEQLMLDGAELYLRRGGDRIALGHLEYSSGWRLATWHGIVPIEKYDTLEVVGDAESSV